MNAADSVMSDDGQRPTTIPRWQRWLAWLAWVLALLLCLAVFGLYTRPDWMLMIANQLWACF